ncbi:MAG TPA: hypothetical protein VF616_23565 [Duganella sp.]|uniref:hypothetical protein n=1 Tax=Duganella sp. TaxID=1904440 RepID=UPI002ED01191
MSWLISAGVMKKNGMQAASRKQGAAAPLALRVASSRHTSSQWSLVSHSTGLASVSQARQIWQGVLSELVDN